MKKLILVITLLAAVLCVQAEAQNDSGFGIGVILGEPTGISGKMWMSQTTALAGAAAWSFSGDAAVHLHLDYIFHSFDVIKVDKGRLPIYYGIGGRIKLADESKFGIRIPVGLDYLFKDAPLDLFLEVVPMLELAPDTEFDLNGGIGIRYFF